MNQINIGAGCVIDTDEIQYSETRDWGDDGKRVLVMFKNGQEAILRGDAKDAFDVWAEERRQAQAERPVENMGGPHSVANCKLCADYNPVTDHCMSMTPMPKEWPGCYREREEAAADD